MESEPQSSSGAAEMCKKCGKSQAELNKPLKRCGKCGTQNYCRRDCQKKDWTKHRKHCARLAAERPDTKDPIGSMAYPWKTDIEKHAAETIEMMEALTTCEGFNTTDATKTTPAVLGHTFDFLIRTFNEYWAPLLPPAQFIDLRSRINLGKPNPDRGKSFMEKIEKLERESTDGFDRLDWPGFDKEKCSDAFSRNILSTLIITDDNKRRAMFPGLEPRGWSFSRHAIDVAKRISSKDNSSKEPSHISDTKAEIEKGARATVKLMEALASVPGFDRINETGTEPRVLKRLFDYCCKTHNMFWGPNLQPLLSVELACSVPLGDDPEGKKERTIAEMAKVEARSNGQFDRYQWPTFKRPEYQDAVGRNATLCSLIVDDEKRRRYFPGMAPEVWTFPENVVDVAKALTARSEDQWEDVTSQDEDDADSVD